MRKASLVPFSTDTSGLPSRLVFRTKMMSSSRKRRTAIAGGLLLGLFLFRRRRRSGSSAALCLALALGLAGSVAAARFKPPAAVVLEPRAPLLDAPSARGETLHSLDAGNGLKVLDAHEEWLRVTTFDGRDGWIEASRVGRLP